MNLLLDTHVFLWFISGDNQLPQRIVDMINNNSNRCFVSIASMWEIAIKLSLGKLEINGGLETIENFLGNNDFEVLPIDIDDLKKLTTLELYHRDPFDRLIIAQAQATNLTVLTRDSQFRKYDIRVEWQA